MKPNRTFAVVRKHDGQPTEVIAESLTLDEAESYLAADDTLTIWATEPATDAA